MQHYCTHCDPSSSDRVRVSPPTLGIVSDLSTFSPPRRDAKGRFVEAPVWLKPGWQHVNAAGLGAGSALRKLCARANCRGIALKSSRYCRHHDFHWRRKRLAELRTYTGRPATPAELAKLYRANSKSLWQRAPWFPTLTIWLAPRLEATFAEDCKRAGLSLSSTAPVCLNTLRWAWRRSVLNYNDDLGWQRALAAARKRQAKIGPPPDDYNYEPPADTPPTDPHIKAVFHRLNALQLARTRPPVDRTTKSKARKAHSHRFRAPASFDWSAFLAERWREVFGPLFKAHQLDPSEADGELGRRLAVTWRAVLDEQVQLGEGVCGAAHSRWMALLREIRQDQNDGTNHYLRRS
nr:hypothetical protein Hi04_10k_c4997_00011 [uncultured bacterium]